MNKLIILLLAMLALNGCAHNYVITLSNGSQITAKSKPRLERGYYFFEDGQGRKSYVAAGRVREIERGGTVKDTSFKAPTSK
jgi:hypothetical protein